jgi:hypothetical protein
VTRFRRLAGTLLLALAAVSCGSKGPTGIDKEVTTMGTAEVTAQLLEIPDQFPPNDLYNYAFVMKYRVLQVHRGTIPTKEIFVAHYNPLKPRATVADDLSGKIGGHLDAFRAGDVHRMALQSPVDQFWMGGIIDKYFSQPGVRYWAVWTNPGSK